MITDILKKHSVIKEAKLAQKYFGHLLIFTRGWDQVEESVDG